MNSSILAERTAKAVQAIQAHTERLGGKLVMPTRAFPDQATKHALVLEAIVEGLAGISAPEPILPSGKHEVEAVEAIITVVKEPEAGSAPKGKAGAKGAPKGKE